MEMSKVKTDWIGEVGIKSEKSPIGLLNKRFFMVGILIILSSQLYKAFVIKHVAADDSEGEKNINSPLSVLSKDAQVVFGLLFLFLVTAPAFYNVGRNITDLRSMWSGLKPLSYAVLIAVVVNSLGFFITTDKTTDTTPVTHKCTSRPDLANCLKRSATGKLRDAVLETAMTVSHVVQLALGEFYPTSAGAGPTGHGTATGFNPIEAGTFTKQDNVGGLSGGLIPNYLTASNVVVIALIFGLVQRAAVKA